MEEIVKALELKNLLESLRPIDREQEARIMQKFRLDWNYHSNNLEGNSLTYGETKALLMFGITAQGKPLKDHSEIKGHNEAIDWVIEVVKGDRPLTESFIRELHRLLLKELYDEKLKKGIKLEAYKTTSNHVITETGETFYFATPEETPAKMADLMAWYNEKIEDENVNPILLAAEFHHKFIIIHPFEDGNGRTARILMNFILMKYGYPPVIIKTEDKVNYFAALRLADAGNITAFIQYIAKNLNRSLEIMIDGAQGKNIEEPDDIDKEIALLEKRLAGYGEELKSKEKRFVLSVYINNIKPCAFEVVAKLNPLQNYYLYTGVAISIDGHTYAYNKAPDILPLHEDIKQIDIIINYNSLKKEGLQDFKFYYNLTFDFEPLKYTVYFSQGEHKKQIFFTKNYDTLTENEMSGIITSIVKSHNKQLEEALGKQ